MPNIPVAIQMYTLRQEAEKDYIGTLKKVAQIGYAGVELSGIPIPMDEARRVIDDLGLKAPSLHAGYDPLVTDIQPTIDMALTMGCSFVTCSGVFSDLRESAAGFRKAGEALSRAGEECAKHGLRLCYHNHAFEFKEFDGKYGYDILFEGGDPKYLQAQIDTYWVKYGGEDPVAYIRKYAGRCPLVHLKDMADDEDRSYAEVGTGTLDWDAIFAASDAAGVEWYIVEQDICKAGELTAAKTSFENLKRMGKA